MDLTVDKVNESVAYIEGSIKRIIETYGDRAPGSEGEIKASNDMAEELKKYSDIVIKEDFPVHNTAFMGWIYISCTFLIAAMLFYYLYPLASLITIFLGILPMVFEFVMYKRFVDFLFDKKTSQNVYAVRKPIGEVKRRIIFNGHSDAAFEWRWHYKYGAKGIKIIAAMTFLGLFVCLGLTIATLIVNGLAAPTHREPLFLYLGLIQIVFIPFVIAMFFFSDNNTVVPGANDNLSACYTSIAVMKALSELNYRPENTEICCLITGSEEAGLRGAKEWAKIHKESVTEVDTSIIVFETLRDAEYLAIYDKDLNGTVKNSKEVCKLIGHAGDMTGKKLKCKTVTLGSTDAAAFSQAGIKAAALAGMSPKPERYYHTRLDNYDNLGSECIEKAFTISMHIVDME
jgi:positive regulator of sigma E activity